MYALSQALRKLRALPPVERRLLVEAALAVPVVHALQQTLPYRRWRKLLTRASAPRARPGSATPDRIAQAVERARRGVPGVYKCLPAAYAAHLLLHRHGFASTVQVGVARDPAGKVEAHAWVEHDGRILIGALPDLVRFVPFPSTGQ